MKDFTEITLCPEALDHSKVGLGMGVPPGRFLPGHLWVPAAWDPRCHPCLLSCRPSSATPSLRVRSPGQRQTLSTRQRRMGPALHCPGTASVPTWGFVHMPLSMGPQRAAMVLGSGWWGKLPTGLWGHLGDPLTSRGQEIGTCSARAQLAVQGGGRVGAWLAAPWLCPLSLPSCRSAALGPGRLAVPC